MFKVIATYVSSATTVNNIFTSEIEETYETLRDAQLAIEDRWEMDLEESDIWVEELSPEEREERFPVKINDHYYRCNEVPGYDLVEYKIIEE